MLVDGRHHPKRNFQRGVEIEQTRPIANLIDMQHDTSHEEARALARPGLQVQGRNLATSGRVVERFEA